MAQERSVESLHGSHVLRQGSGDELQQESEATEDAAADLRGDVVGGDEAYQGRGNPGKVREEGALEVPPEDREELQGFLSGLEKKMRPQGQGARCLSSLFEKTVPSTKSSVLC